MQQDGIQRAIEMKQQQLKPLEAEVRGRSRQATRSFLHGIPCLLDIQAQGARVFRVQRRSNERSECDLQHVTKVPKKDCKPFKCTKPQCQWSAGSGRTIGQLPERRKLKLRGVSGGCMPMCWSCAGDLVP